VTWVRRGITRALGKGRVNLRAGARASEGDWRIIPMAELKPWFHVVTSREVLREGRPLDASEFAVHLDHIRSPVTRSSCVKLQRAISLRCPESGRR
jgi:hypothetical protein